MSTANTTLEDVEIFEAGPQTDSRGNTREWTAAELDEMVANFQADGDTVPAVVGHPEDDAPAYAWMARLRRAGQRLVASFRDVAPEFAEMVLAKRFPNRSLKVVRSDRGWQIAHVGWLGAAAPAVKGLKPVNFSSVEADDVRLYHTPIAQEPPMSQPKTFTQADVDAAAKKATDDAKAAVDAELAQLRADKAKAEFGQRLAASREVIAKAAVRGDDVHLTPAQIEGLAEFRTRLLDIDQAEFTFTAGEKEQKVTLAAHFDAFLNSLPSQMKLGQQRATDDPAATSAAQFNAPPGFTVNAERAELHNKALAYQKAHPNTDYLTAVQAVS